MINKSPETMPPLPDVSETEAALKTLLACERLRKNPSLRHMLEYLVTRTLSGNQDHIKETTVAMDVFGRSQDFDSRIDNIVRVQAHRLRKLLAAYYEAEGAEERIRFSIPRGGYIPRIEELTVNQPAEQESAPASGMEAALPEHDQAYPVEKRRPLPLVPLAFAAGILVAVASFGLWRWAVPAPSRAVGAESARSGPLAALWSPILKPGIDCIVSYSNPVFLATGDPPMPRILIPYGGLLSVPAGARINVSPGDLNLPSGMLGANPAFFFSDGWTGVGEVMAMQRLTSLFSPEVALRVVRSRVLTYSDIREGNVIFLGSPWANDMQKKINVGFTPMVNDNDGNILNLRPKNGEPARFRAQIDPATRQITSTYALFSVLPGIRPGTKVFISAGVNTYGTQAAIEFMTGSAGVREVMKKLGTAPNLPEYFQLVVRSDMIRGEPAETRLVLARDIRQKS